MFSKSVLVTGSNRGIGLELVKQLAKQTEILFAACRNPSAAEDLNKFADINKNIKVVQLDVCDEKSIDAAKVKVSDLLGDQGLTCLINNAGQMDYSDSKVENITSNGLRNMYEINAIGPAMVIKSFLPLLRKAASQSSSEQMSVARAAILNISSQIASIVDNKSGGIYGYRMAKIALNMLTKNLSIELKADKILAVNLHPGWVKTDLGGPKAPTTTEESVENMLKLSSSFTEEHNGTFYKWNGEVLPW